jgi:2-amino-4-hydroxy-6-hydroxymethyldihydropteridine diphosphokinase
MAKASGVFLSVGSNLGDRLYNLRTALAQLPSHGVWIIRCSSVIESEPVDLVEQPPFLNLVCEVQTSATPEELLGACHAVEQASGRVRSVPKGPRSLDIDILYYGSLVHSCANLEVPHPRLTLRRFVLTPLAEIAPAFRDPRTGETVAELLSKCPDRSWVRRLDSDP